MEFSLVSWIVRMSIFSWMRSCCSSSVLFWIPFLDTVIFSILSCLFLGCGLLVSVVCVYSGALSVLLVRVVICGLLVDEDCV